MYYYTLMNNCKLFEYLFLECMKRPVMKNKCKNEFETWLKCYEKLN